MPPPKRGSGWERDAVRTAVPTCRTSQEHQLPLSTCHVRSGSLDDVELDRARLDGRAAAMAADLQPAPSRDADHTCLPLLSRVDNP
jgi:hypothetical protein